jgi:hypothetical protein
MFDEITEKLLKSTTALYMPKLEELAKGLVEKIKEV